MLMLQHSIFPLSKCFPDWTLHNFHQPLLLFFFLNKFHLFIYFWLCWLFVAAWVLSLGAESRGCSLVVVHGLLIMMASLVEHGL